MDIIKIITDYVSRSDVDGAVMINGKWGIGKSFYWREKIVPAIEKIKKSLH